MKKNIIAFTLFILTIVMVSCGHTNQKTNTGIEPVNILKAKLGNDDILKKGKTTIHRMENLNLETDVAISKIVMTITLPNKKSIDKEFKPNTSTFTVNISEFEDGKNELYVIVYAENRKRASLLVYVYFDKPSLNPLVYVDNSYNIVQNENDVIKINNENAKIMVESDVAISSAFINDGTKHNMLIDSENKKATYDIKDISSVSKTIVIELASEGYKTFKLTFALVKGIPDIKVIKAKFENKEFNFDENNVAIIKEADIKYASGLLELEFNTKDGVNVEILDSTSGYVSQVVKGSGLKGDIGRKEDLTFLSNNKFSLNIIIINKETKVKLKAKANDHNPVEYTLDIESIEKGNLSQGAKLAVRNAYSNKGGGFTYDRLIWPYIYTDGIGTYYKTMGDLIACNFEYVGVDQTFYVYTRLKNKADKDNEEGAWIKWGPSKYVENWDTSILNIRTTSEQKVEFYLDGIYANEDLKPVLMAKALFTCVAKHGMLFDAATVIKNEKGEKTVRMNTTFAEKGRDYIKSIDAFEKVNSTGFVINASQVGLNAESDFFRGYWTSSKEIEEVRTKISMQNSQGETPTVVPDWDNVKTRIGFNDNGDIRKFNFIWKEGGSYFQFEKNRIYTIELSIKMKDEAEIAKAKYIIDYTK